MRGKCRIQIRGKDGGYVAKTGQDDEAEYKLVPKLYDAHVFDGHAAAKQCFSEHFDLTEEQKKAGKVIQVKYRPAL